MYLTPNLFYSQATSKFWRCRKFKELERKWIVCSICPFLCYLCLWEK